jgi:hypothetical protein
MGKNPSNRLVVLLPFYETLVTTANLLVISKLAEKNETIMSF